MVSDVMLHWSYHHLITTGSWSRLLPQFLNHTQTLNVDRRINKAASLQVDHGKEERKLEPSARSDPAQSMKINPGSIKKVKDAQLNL